MCLEKGSEHFESAVCETIHYLIPNSFRGTHVPLCIFYKKKVILFGVDKLEKNM